MAIGIVAWTKDLATGNDAIDGQHKRWLEALGVFYKAHARGMGAEDVARMLNALLERTADHFNREEELMRTHGFPEFERHKKLHDGFKGVAKNLADTLQKEGPNESLIARIYTTLSSWLITHIMGEDMKLAAFLPNE